MKHHNLWKRIVAVLAVTVLVLLGTSTAIAAPTNDNFASATVVGTLPFGDTQDTSSATLEFGEPVPSCAAFSSPTGSLWYAYTTPTGVSVMSNVSTWFPSVLAVYTGSSLNSLTEIGCRTYGSNFVFNANPGTTYYFQVSGMYGYSGGLTFNLQVTPPPVVGFNWYPYDPSVYDNVQFSDSSYDPASIWFQTYTWSFGDGTTASDPSGYVSHRYTADGDYTVKHTATTNDGRSGSSTQIVHVKTHDVAITKFTVPTAASAGQTRQISVDVKNNRYDENVQVQLLKSTPSGFQTVGTLTQFVPIRSSNRTTTFAFNYTFTNDDAAIGKVTFRAVASIVNARDSLPADNEAIASPTKVSR